MHPDPQYLVKLEEEEEKELSSLTNTLTEEKKNEIIQKATALADRQGVTDDPFCLPTLTLDDVARVREFILFPFAFFLIISFWYYSGDSLYSIDP
jgi:Zn-dependent M16 (insulinase) family peptidase